MYNDVLRDTKLVFKTKYIHVNIENYSHVELLLAKSWMLAAGC